MGVFDNVADVPGQLSSEALQVTLQFQPGVPAAGQGTISWNIPVSDSAISGGTGPLAYAGIVIVVCDQPVTGHNIPKNGLTFLADPTFDPKLFSGDRIGNARVIGYIYEPDVVAKGGTLTTSIVVNNLDLSQNYYICGYILDAQRRYDQNGSRAYSDRLGAANQPGSPASQTILLGFNPNNLTAGVLPTAGTNLVSGATYQFQVIYDSGYPYGKNTVRNMLISFDGSVAGTYGDMVKEINKQLAIKSSAIGTFVSPVTPGAGIYYWNGTQLFIWNGTQLIPVIGISSQSTAPTNPQLGQYWYNTLTNILSQWNGTAWIPVPNTTVSILPPLPPTAGTFWYNPISVTLLQWNGTAWVTIPNTFVQTSAPVTTIIGSYWYNPMTALLSIWNGTAWVAAPNQVITSSTAPSGPVVGAYWYNPSTGVLSQWNGTMWVTVPNTTGVIIQATDPSLVPIGTYWYNPTTNILSQWNGTTWVVIPFISDATDPTNPPPGTWWWNGTNAFTRCGNTWCEVPANETFISTTDPSCPVAPVNCAFWYDPANMTLQQNNGVQWLPAFAVTWPVAPNAITLGSYWYDLTNNVLYIRNAGPVWGVQPFISSTTDPSLVATNAVVAGTLWYDPATEVLNLRNAGNTAWIVTPVLVWPTDPTIVVSCSLWFDDSGSSPGILKEWDIINNTWDPVTPFFNQTTDPFGTPVIPTGAVWFNPVTGVLSVWNGSNWVAVTFISNPTDPTAPTTGTVWHNTTTNLWYIWGTPTAGAWNQIAPVVSTTPPNQLPIGQLWFDTATNVLYIWNGTGWTSVPYTTTPPSLQKGQNWYNTINGKLYQWNGTQWVWIKPIVYCRFDAHGNIVFETTGCGSNYVVMVPIPNGIPYMASGLVVYGTGAADFVNDIGTQNAYFPYGAAGGASLFDIPLADGFYYNGLYSGLDYFGDFSGNLGNGVGELDAWVGFNGGGLGKPIPYRALPISPNAFVWAQLKPVSNILVPCGGQDGVSGTPSYDELGVGTDGTPDERRNIMKIIRTELGYPTVTVELTDDQLNRAVQDALETFRQRSSMSVKRACFFLDIQPYNQHYVLSNKAVDYNKIVTVMAGYRFTSAFLSQAMGSGVYGQVVLQHLYNMGTFDLLSYHIVSQYVEQLEIMFATRLTYVWDEAKRKISFHQSFTRPERILLDVTLEKTEQEIFTDRYAKRWIQQFAQAQAMDMLAQIRGKYANLPGASGSVTLNALDLRTQAKDIRDALYLELDELIVQDVESYGAYGSIVMG